MKSINIGTGAYRPGVAVRLPTNRCCLYRGIVQRKQRLAIYLVPVVEKSEAHTAMIIIVNIAIHL
jgi:hypothetical protein